MTTDVKLSGYKPHEVYRNQNTRDAWIISERDGVRLIMWQLLTKWSPDHPTNFYNLEYPDRKIWVWNSQTKNHKHIPSYEPVTVDSLPKYWKEHLKKESITLIDFNNPGWNALNVELKDD